MIETMYRLQPWVIKNLVKILKQKESEKLRRDKIRDNEKVLRGIRRLMMSVSKDLKAFQRDLKIREEIRKVTMRKFLEESEG